MPNRFSQFNTRDIFDRDAGKFEPRPYRAWAIIFFIGVFLSVSVLFGHFFLYEYMRSNDSFKPDEGFAAVGEIKLDRKSLSEVAALFEKKNKEFENLLVSAPSIPDPSSSENSQIIPPENIHDMLPSGAETAAAPLE